MSDIHSVLNERKTTHGEYTEHARCTQRIMDAMMVERNWAELDPIQKESLHMIAHKIGRIMVGNPNHEDHYTDIIGYTQLVLDRLPGLASAYKPGCPDGMDNPRGFDPERDVYQEPLT